MTALSDSMEMYLVTIARLRMDSEPVPLSHLGQALSISPGSVNEMCRKLQDQGLVIYQPYKGVSLTAEGERQAHYVLRRHRLWEVFLVKELGFDHAQAHEAACQLEHATPHLVVERLDAFLGYPSVNPKGDLIPGTDGSLAVRRLIPLATVSVGQRAHVVSRELSEAARGFLDQGGLRPGTSLIVVATAEETLLVKVDEAHVCLARTLAEGIQVEADEKEGEPETEDALSGSAEKREEEEWTIEAS